MLKILQTTILLNKLVDDINNISKNYKTNNRKQTPAPAYVNKCYRLFGYLDKFLKIIFFKKGFLNCFLFLKF